MCRPMYIPLLCMLLSLFGSCSKHSDNANNENDGENWPSDSIRFLRQDLDLPWEILWGKDDFIWMTERGGKISKLDPVTGATVFSQAFPEVVSNGEGGMLGMVQHPDFLTNGYLYVVYDYNTGSSYREKVVRLTFSNNTLSNPLTLIEGIPASSIHNGSRLLITAGNDPKLLITTGDASAQSNPQKITSVSGKILRLNLDGTIPADNPVAGNPYWSFGHRNPQGLVQANDILYSSEHGPNVEDEVNIIEKGGNYGWPDVKGPCDGGEIDFCEANSVREPIWSSGGSTVAVCGMDYYNKDRIPGWKNSLLMTTLKDETLFQHQLSADGRTITSTKEYFSGKWGRLRDVCISPAGRVYLCTSNGANKDVLVEITTPD
jgi:glucose/arabinose dehydrogenase